MANAPSPTGALTLIDDVLDPETYTGEADVDTALAAIRACETVSALEDLLARWGCAGGYGDIDEAFRREAVKLAAEQAWARREDRR